MKMYLTHPARQQPAKRSTTGKAPECKVIITEVVQSSPFSSSLSMLKNWRTKETENSQIRLVTGIRSKGRNEGSLLREQCRNWPIWTRGPTGRRDHNKISQVR